MKKHILRIIPALVIASVAASCGGNSQKSEARRLLDEASRAVETRQWAAADSLIASLDSLCPSAIDERRKGMAVRAEAREGLAIEQLAMADSTAVAMQMKVDSLSRLPEPKTPAQDIELAEAQQALAVAALEHQRLEEVLAVARRHRAVTAPDPE